ncbi:MAG: ABC transporter ATP-binding protein [Aeromicrobium sp.]
MSESLLTLDDVRSGYGQVEVLRGLSLSIGRGEIVALLGPNGAGKTTTLLTAVGLVPLMSGHVRIEGYDKKKPRPSALARNGVVLVADDRGLCPGLTVKEHFRLSQRKSSKSAENEMLDHFPQLRGIRDRKAGLMSGGEQQMLAIAKALLASPRVMLIDEMSLGLAPKIVQEMFPAIRAIAKARDIGVLLVEQHIEVALSVSDRGIVLNHGRVVLEGPASELLRERGRVQDAYFDTVTS